MDGPEVIALIPARRASRRLPGKALVDLAGIPMVVRVAQQASRAHRIDQVRVATDDRQIASVVRAWGFEAELTGEHRSGTDRIAELVHRLGDPKLVLNVQGDEPLIDPVDLDALVDGVTRARAPVGTLARPERPPDPLPADPAQVWVSFCESKGWAKDFWRGRGRTGAEAGLVVRAHVGVYAFEPRALTRLVSLPQSRLECARGLEQMRALENEVPIHVTMCQTEHPSLGVDTWADLAAVRARLRQRPPA